MKSIGILLLSLVTLLSISLNIYLYQQLTGQNTVVKVLDGDTFDLKSNVRVRLLGVDAPETNYCGADKAKERLEQLILGKKVRLEKGDYKDYARILAMVYVDKLLVNEILLKEGWARIMSVQASQKNKLVSAYNFAKSQKLGIFSLCEFRNPPDPNCPIKGNIDSSTGKKIYHLPGCYYYNDTTISLDLGERFFCTQEEAEKEGFTKATNCQ